MYKNDVQIPALLNHYSKNIDVKGLKATKSLANCSWKYSIPRLELESRTNKSDKTTVRIKNVKYIQ